MWLKTSVELAEMPARAPKPQTGLDSLPHLSHHSRLHCRFIGAAKLDRAEPLATKQAYLTLTKLPPENWNMESIHMKVGVTKCVPMCFSLLPGLLWRCIPRDMSLAISHEHSSLWLTAHELRSFTLSSQWYGDSDLRLLPWITYSIIFHPDLL